MAREVSGVAEFFISPLCVLVVELVYLSSARCLWKGDKIFVLTFDVPFLLSPFIP